MSVCDSISSFFFLSPLVNCRKYIRRVVYFFVGRQPKRHGWRHPMAMRCNACGHLKVLQSLSLSLSRLLRRVLEIWWSFLTCSKRLSPAATTPKIKQRLRPSCSWYLRWAVCFKLYTSTRFSGLSLFDRHTRRSFLSFSLCRTHTQVFPFLLYIFFKMPILFFFFFVLVPPPYCLVWCVNSFSSGPPSLHFFAPLINILRFCLKTRGGFVDSLIHFLHVLFHPKCLFPGLFLVGYFVEMNGR